MQVGDGRGSSGEGNEVIAGQTGVAGWGMKAKSLRASCGQVKNNAEGAWESGNGWREGWRGTMSRYPHNIGRHCDFFFFF